MKDNQHEKLFALTGIAGVQELSHETAAAIQGGAALEVFGDRNFEDRVGSFNVRSPQVKANDQISSFRINAGTWRFFEDANYKGRYLDAFGSGNFVLKGFWDNRISSLKRIS